MSKVIYISVIMGLSLFISSCKKDASNKMNAADPVSVNIYQVKEEKASYYDAYPGNLVPVNQVEFRSEVSGYITGIYFQDGQQVKKGQKLYEIDRSKYAATYEQAKANVQIAEDNLEKAQQDADRYTSLSKQDAVAKQRLDYALTDLQNAKSQLVAATAEMTRAQTDLKYSVIVAPFDGTIGISQVKTGTFINPGQTLLNILSSDDPMGVDFVIDEKDLTRFTMLNKRPVLPNDSTYRIQLPDNTIYSRTGRISFIDRAVDPQTGTIRLRLIFPNNDRILKPGLSCEVLVLNDDRKPKVMIPSKAIVEQLGEYFVFVVNGNKVKQTKVSLGQKIGNKVIANEGLKPGETVVTDGIQRLRDGALVQWGAPKVNKNLATR